MVTQFLKINATSLAMKFQEANTHEIVFLFFIFRQIQTIGCGVWCNWNHSVVPFPVDE